MAKRKKKTDAAKESDRVLGDDPFEQLDMEWMEREEGELYLQILGQDPFQGMDLDLMHPEVAPEDEQPSELGLGELETPMGEMRAESTISVIKGADELILDQVGPERLSPELVSGAVEPLAQPKPLEPIKSARSIGVVAGEKKAVSLPRARFHFPAAFK